MTYEQKILCSTVIQVAIDDLNADGIYTLDDLEKAIAKVKDKSHSTQQSIRSKKRRMKELEKMID